MFTFIIKTKTFYIMVSPYLTVSVRRYCKKGCVWKKDHNNMMIWYTLHFPFLFERSIAKEKNGNYQVSHMKRSTPTFTISYSHEWQ